MKFLALVVLVFGLAAASATNSLKAALDRGVDDVVAAFEEGMASVPALSVAVSEDSNEANAVDSDSKSELAKALKESLEDTINKIKDQIDHRHEKAQDLIKKANELVDKLKQLKETVGDKAKDLIASYKQKVADLFNKLIEKIRGGDRDKRDVSEEVILESLNLSSMLEKVKERLREKINSEKITQYVQELFGRFNPLAQEFIRTLQNRGQAALTKVIDHILSVLKPRQTRALKDVAQKVRDFFQNLGINVRERYADFAEWLSGVWEKGVGHAKSKIEALREIAREVTSHAKEMHKETVREAVEALRPFRDQLGDMWRELLDAAKESLKRKEE